MYLEFGNIMLGRLINKQHGQNTNSEPLGMPSIFETSWWVGFNEGDLKIFRPKVREILNFE